MTYTPPSYHCDLCPRLHDFIIDNRKKYPDEFNGPVPSFGSLDAELLIIGLAPGLKGANFTGRPFTNDYAGDLLYSTLLKFNLAKGTYQKHANDGLELINCRITNAVRCVPPQNKPESSEINQCRPFLQDEISHLKNLKAILTLGTISHKSTIANFGLKQKDYKFSHNAAHEIPTEQHPNNITLFNSYHCSRYNTNTKRLTNSMFHDVFISIEKRLN